LWERGDRSCCQGADAEVIDLRTLSFWDEEANLVLASKTKRVVIVRKVVCPVGAGAEISARIHEDLFGLLVSQAGRATSDPSSVSFLKPMN